MYDITLSIRINDYINFCKVLINFSILIENVLNRNITYFYGSFFDHKLLNYSLCYNENIVTDTYYRRYCFRYFGVENEIFDQRLLYLLRSSDIDYNMRYLTTYLDYFYEKYFIQWFCF